MSIEVRRVIFIHPDSIPPPGAVVADAFTAALARHFYELNTDAQLAELGPTAERTLCVSVFLGLEAECLCW